MSHLLSPRDYVARACDATGLTNFGPDGWQEALDRLVDALSEHRFHAEGVTRIEGRLIETLSARLRIEDWIARVGDDSEDKIEGPLVIIGLPRTATTALQNLLSNDPVWRFVRAWEAREPVPPPDIATEANDPRALAERAWLETDKTYQGKHIHEAGGPVDDAAILRLSFHNQELGWPAWSYTRWWRDCDMRGAYSYHARVLRLLQHRRPPNRWLIKAPWHNFHLDELIETYPDARFVMTHRDPLELVPSAASLIETAYTTLMPRENVDRVALGRDMVEHLRISLARVMDFRRRHGDERFLDIYHSRFNADPLGEVRRIYDWLGLSLTQEASAALSDWAALNRKGARGEHRYTAESYGISRDELAQAFSEYRDEFC